MVRETIHVIPEVLGEQGYKHFVLGDLLKRIFRLRNQFRERDLYKIAVWSYLLYLRYFYKGNKESKFAAFDEFIEGMRLVMNQGTDKYAGGDDEYPKKIPIKVKENGNITIKFPAKVNHIKEKDGKNNP